jgi:hypothetical protein
VCFLTVLLILFEIQGIGSGKWSIHLQGVQKEFSLPKQETRARSGLDTTGMRAGLLPCFIFLQ